MKVLSLIQGTPEWNRHRATCWNASDAPAMLGVSTHMTRRELLDAIATGLPREFSDYVEKNIIAPGHRNEALSRELAEKIIGDDLYPVIGVPDDPASKLSASFDGLTLDESTAWEHKRLNAELRAVLSREGCTGADLPEMYRVQMEQQAMISGASRVLFMASEWDADGSLVEELHCWYTPDPELRARIVAGWAQFERDLDGHQPEPAAAPAAVGRAPETLPALRVEAQGMVTFSNLAEFRTNALTVLGSINRDLKTDDDFADAESTVKWCKGVEDRLDAAKANVLAQMQSVDEVCRTIDSVSAETRKVRLELDRLVKVEKEHRRAEIVQHYQQQVQAHLDNINETLGQYALPMPTGALAEIGAAIKGRKTLGSITDAADAECANLKIALSQTAERVRQNIAILNEHKDAVHLFADAVQLALTKQPDDLRNLAAARIADHQQREAARLEAERARIRKEEEARAERLRQQAVAEVERQRRASDAAEEQQRNGDAMRRAMANRQQSMPEGGATGAVSSAHPEQAPAATVRSGAKIKLGEINESIAPLSISAAGLSELGFEPVGHERAAKLYAAESLPDIYRALLQVIDHAQFPQQVRRSA